jgi:hypothetical protein
MSELESQEGHAAAAAPDDGADTARRQALRTLGKAAYIAPAVIATLAATKALAASLPP